MIICNVLKETLWQTGSLDITSSGKFRTQKEKSAESITFCFNNAPHEVYVWEKFLLKKEKNNNLKYIFNKAINLEKNKICATLWLNTDVCTIKLQFFVPKCLHLIFETKNCDRNWFIFLLLEQFNIIQSSR